MKISPSDFVKVAEKANELVISVGMENPLFGFDKVSEYHTMLVLKAVQELENEKCYQCENQGWTWVTDASGKHERWFCWCEAGDKMRMHRDRMLANRKRG